jgi:intracellular sulfur oxidation DsrE/DsrF family protein
MSAIPGIPPRARPRTAGTAVSIASWLLALSALGFNCAEAQPLPVPSAGLPGYVTGAQEVPDPGLTYKVVFNLSSAGSMDKVHPTLERIARYLNALAEYGVPPNRRQLTIIVYGPATQFVLKDAAFAARNHGKHNPNAAFISQLRQAGVITRVCGQALIAQHIQPRDVLPTVELDYWALSTRVNLEQHGYVVEQELVEGK